MKTIKNNIPTVIHLSTQRTWGGGEQQVLSLIDQLKNKDIKQILLCPKDSALYNKAKKNGVTVFGLASKLRFYKFFSLKKHLKNKDILVHAHDSLAHQLIYLYNLLFNAKIKTIITKRMVKTKKLNFASKQRYQSNYCKKIICISSKVRESIASEVPTEKLLTIPSGIKTKYLKSTLSIANELKLPTQSRFIINVGSLTDQKNQSFFIETCHKLIQRKVVQNTYFLILGEGPNKAKLLQQIEDLGLKNYCFILGFKEKARDWIANADLLLSTSSNEALGNVIMEAFCTATPVIAANSGGVIDLVVDGETGKLLSTDSPQKWAQACEDILTNEELALSFANSAKLKIKNFDIKLVSEKIYEIYKSVD